MTRRNVTVIRNPVAGRGAGEKTWGAAKELLDRYTDIVVTEVTTRAPGHGAELAAQAVRAGTELILVYGGDGTINEVASRLVCTDCPLAPIPVGTGNDLARCLGIPFDTSAAIVSALRGVIRTIDTGTWKCGDRDGIFVNVAGAGFDALVAQRINRGFRMLRGTSAYLAAVIQTLARFRPAKLDLVTDGRTRGSTMTLCAVANATCYGGGMQIAPNAKIDDGLLDVVLIEGVGRIEFLSAFPRVFEGTHVSHPKVHVDHAKDIAMLTDPSVPVLADGEVVGMTPVVFGIRPSSLKVVVPK